MDAAVVPRRVRMLQRARRREARYAEGGERRPQHLGRRSGERRALEPAGPGRENLRQGAQVGKGVDANGAQPGRGEESKLGLDDHRAFGGRQEAVFEPAKLGLQPDLLNGGEGVRRRGSGRPERRQARKLLGHRGAKLAEFRRWKVREHRGDRQAAALIEQRDVARQAGGDLAHTGRLREIGRSDDSQAGLWAIAEQLARCPAGEVVERRLIAVGQHAMGEGEDRLFDLAVAADPGRGGIGIAERPFAAGQGFKKRGGEPRFGRRRFEQCRKAQGDRGGKRLDREAGEIAGEDGEDETRLRPPALLGGPQQRPEGRLPDAPQDRGERRVEPRGGETAGADEQGVQAPTFGGGRIEKGLDGLAPGGDQSRLGQVGEARLRRRERLGELGEVHPKIVTRSKLSTMAPPEVSVVVPTFNRRDVLPEVLAALDSQVGAPPFEVVVVDDGSSDGTAELLERYAAVSRNVPFRFLRQDNRGPAAARNAGVEVAAAPWVAFLGDDTVPAPGWLAAHRDAHRRGGDDPLQAVIGYTGWHSRMRLNPFLRYINEYGLQFGYALITDPDDVPFNFFYTSNLSLSRELLRAEPFDLRFPYPAWEDIEVAYRMKKKRGLRLTYESRATVAHDHPTDLSRFAQRQEKAGFCGVVFYRLHPELGPFVGVGPDGPPPVPPEGRQRRLERLVRALQKFPVSLPRIWEEVLRFHYVKGLHRAWRCDDGTTQGEVQ